MEFDRNKVFTAFNAEELKIGSKCIFANSVDSLESQVEANSYSTYIQRLDQVLGTSLTNRFKSGDKTYNLAYFISERDLLKWTDLKVGDVIITKRTVVEIDTKETTTMHIRAVSNDSDECGGYWLSDSEISDEWKKVEEPVNHFRNANLNEYIKVKLTAKGKQIYNDRYNGKMEIHYDDNGYATFQMWDFMRIFGGEHMSMLSELVCETDVMIEVKE